MIIKDTSSALILIDIQKGFNDFEYWGKRNNLNFEKNIIKLINKYRERSLQIIHIQHSSLNSNSPLNKNSIGFSFMDCATPISDEPVFQKQVNSAFIGTNLETFLRERKIQNLTMAGLTTDHCVSTSCRMAANLGFSVVLIQDAMATFDRKSADGQTFSAELVHEVSLASLNGEFCKIEPTENH